MVDFTLVTCSSHVSVLYPPPLATKVQFWICELYSSYFLFVWPNSWYFFVSTNRVGLKHELPTENLHVPSSRNDWDYHRRTARGQRCAKPVESMLQPVWTYLCSRPQVPFITGVYLRYIRGFLWDWTPCILSHHHVIFDIAVKVWYNVMLWLGQFGYFNVLFRTGWKYTSTVFVLY